MAGFFSNIEPESLFGNLKIEYRFNGFLFNQYIHSIVVSSSGEICIILLNGNVVRVSHDRKTVHYSKIGFCFVDETKSHNDNKLDGLITKKERNMINKFDVMYASTNSCKHYQTISGNEGKQVSATITDDYIEHFVILETKLKFDRNSDFDKDKKLTTVQNEHLLDKFYVKNTYGSNRVLPIPCGFYERKCSMWTFSTDVDQLHIDDFGNIYCMVYTRSDGDRYLVIQFSNKIEEEKFSYTSLNKWSMDKYYSRSRNKKFYKKYNSIKIIDLDGIVSKMNIEDLFNLYICSFFVSEKQRVYFCVRSRTEVHHYYLITDNRLILNISPTVPPYRYYLSEGFSQISYGNFATSYDGTLFYTLDFCNVHERSGIFPVRTNMCNYIIWKTMFGQRTKLFSKGIDWISKFNLMKTCKRPMHKMLPEWPMEIVNRILWYYLSSITNDVTKCFDPKSYMIRTSHTMDMYGMEKIIDICQSALTGENHSDPYIVQNKIFTYEQINDRINNIEYIYLTKPLVFELGVLLIFGDSIIAQLFTKKDGVCLDTERLKQYRFEWRQMNAYQRMCVVKAWGEEKEQFDIFTSRYQQFVNTRKVWSEIWNSIMFSKPKHKAKNRFTITNPDESMELQDIEYYLGFPEQECPFVWKQHNINDCNLAWSFAEIKKMYKK